MDYKAILSRHERGYDNRWAKLSKAKLRADPLCEYCLAQGKVTPAQEVDHVIPFKTINDPKRLDWDNLKSTCRACHNQKTHGNMNGCDRDGVPLSNEWW